MVLGCLEVDDLAEGRGAARCWTLDRLIEGRDFEVQSCRNARRWKLDYSAEGRSVGNRDHEARCHLRVQRLAADRDCRNCRRRSFLMPVHPLQCCHRRSLRFADLPIGDHEPHYQSSSQIRLVTN